MSKSPAAVSVLEIEAKRFSCLACSMSFHPKHRLSRSARTLRNFTAKIHPTHPETAEGKPCFELQCFDFSFLLLVFSPFQQPSRRGDSETFSDVVRKGQGALPAGSPDKCSITTNQSYKQQETHTTSRTTPSLQLPLPHHMNSIKFEEPASTHHSPTCNTQRLLFACT